MIISMTMAILCRALATPATVFSERNKHALASGEREQKEGRKWREKDRII